jgi:uncharacterized cupredoxin-like copper-binding protein
MKIQILTAAISSLLVAASTYAAGDLSRANPEKIVIEMGTQGTQMYFKPNHLDLETGKAYKLVLKNVDKVKHELDPGEFGAKIFTRKVEVVHDGQMLAEIKGSLREIEVGPGGEVEWLVVPVQTGKDLYFECALEGHREAGMTGTVTIN